MLTTSRSSLDRRKDRNIVVLFYAPKEGEVSLMNC